MKSVSTPTVVCHTEVATMSLACSFTVKVVNLSSISDAAYMGVPKAVTNFVRTNQVNLEQHVYPSNTLCAKGSGTSTRSKVIVTLEFVVDEDEEEMRSLRDPNVAHPEEFHEYRVTVTFHGPYSAPVREFMRDAPIPVKQLLSGQYIQRGLKVRIAASTIKESPALLDHMAKDVPS